MGGPRPGILAHRHVELTVSAEVYGPAVVVLRRGQGATESNLLVVDISHDFAVAVLKSGQRGTRLWTEVSKVV